MYARDPVWKSEKLIFFFLSLNQAGKNGRKNGKVVPHNALLKGLSTATDPMHISHHTLSFAGPSSPSRT